MTFDRALVDLLAKALYENDSMVTAVLDRLETINSHVRMLNQDLEEAAKRLKTAVPKAIGEVKLPLGGL